jgi:hypothetical protein
MKEGRETSESWNESRGGNREKVVGIGGSGEGIGRAVVFGEELTEGD